MSQGTRPRILVVDDERASQELLRRLLSQEGYEVVSAASGDDGFNKATRQVPDVAVISAVLPGVDGYALCRRLRQTAVTHALPILMLATKGDVADKIAGFEAGADDVLTKPFEPAELLYRLKRYLARPQAPTPRPVEEPRARGRIIVCFGSKGGVGKTTIAVNLAVALKQRTSQRVALFDADFFFGDVGIHLNLPTTRTVLDLLDRADRFDSAVADEVLVPHSSGLEALLGPTHPEDADQITPEHMEQVLTFLAHQYDYVVVDTQPSYDDRMLMVLDQADAILVIVTPEVGPLKNTSLLLDLAVKLGLSLSKVHIVVNRANSNVGIESVEIERALQHQVAYRVVSGGRPVVLSVNRGVPLVVEQPDHPFSQQILKMADQVKMVAPAER